MLELELQLVKVFFVVKEINEGFNVGGVVYIFEIYEAVVWDDGSLIIGYDFVFIFKVIFNFKVNVVYYCVYLEFISEVEVNVDNFKVFMVYVNKKYIFGEFVISNMIVLFVYIYDLEGLFSLYCVVDLFDFEVVVCFVEFDLGLQVFVDVFNSFKYFWEKGFVFGFGFYIFEGWEIGQKIELFCKIDWWGDVLQVDYFMFSVVLEWLVFMIIFDQIVMLVVFKDEQIDVMSQIDVEDFVSFRDNELVSDCYELYMLLVFVYYFIGFNNKFLKLVDKRVCWVLAYLFDVDELINIFYNGLAICIVGFFYFIKFYYYDELFFIFFDLEQVCSLLVEVGWEDINGNGIVDKNFNGVFIELELDYIISLVSKFVNNQVFFFQDNVKWAGVSINIEFKEFIVLIDQVKKCDYEIYFSGWG